MHNVNMPVIAIIGGGFCGLMTAINVIEKSPMPIAITLINKDFPTAKGVAFSAHTEAYLLNVAASNMSCFADDLRHFMRWLQQQPAYKAVPENMLERMFVPRKLYGEYLLQTWESAKQSNPQVIVTEVIAKATNVTVENGVSTVMCDNGETVRANYLVLATGNEKPSSPYITNAAFYNSPRYFANPWNADAVRNINNEDVLIIGNGLTMVDTVLGLLEQNYKGTIYSLSPNGFSLLPHIGHGVLYKELLNELKPPFKLAELYKLFSKHIKLVSAIGLSAEPVIDSVRVKTQEIWAALSLEDKRQFLRHIKYKWGIARHRLPAHIHRKLQQLRVDKKLVSCKASLQNLDENNNSVTVTFYDKKLQQTQTINVARVINCTGPVSDITRSDNKLIKNLVTNNLIAPDPLKLGINASFDGEIIDATGNISDTLFTLGSHMKGILWESTAVPDLRVQADRLAGLLLNKIYQKQTGKHTPQTLPQRLKPKTPQPTKAEELIEYYI